MSRPKCGFGECQSVPFAESYTEIYPVVLNWLPTQWYIENPVLEHISGSPIKEFVESESGNPSKSCSIIL